MSATKIRGVILSTALTFLGLLSTLPAFAKSLVLAGGGFKDLTTTVYQTDGVTPRAPGTGPIGDANTVAIYQKILALTGGTKKIGVITTASDAASAAANGKYYVDVFKYFGASSTGTQWIPIVINSSGTACATNNSDAAIVSQINSMDGFFIGGGDQSRIIRCFFNTSGSNRTDSPVMTALRNRYNAGAVVAGTSAGTAIQTGIPMITGGESYYALRNGAYTSVNGDNLSYDAKGGFGFFTYGALDTHFSERGRQGRIVRLAWNQYQNMAYGVDENTALVVTNVDTSSAVMEAIGQNGVSIFDLSQASSTRVSPIDSRACSSASNFKLCYIKTTYLTKGDTFAPTSKTYVPVGKYALTGSGTVQSLPSPQDIFSSPDNSISTGRRNPREFINLTLSLLNSSASKTTELTYEGTSSSTFRACLAKSANAGTQGYFGTFSGVTVTSFTNLVMDLLPSSTSCP